MLFKRKSRSPFPVGTRVQVREDASWHAGRLGGSDSQYNGALGTVVSPQEHPIGQGAPDGPLGGYDCIVAIDGEGTARFNYHELQAA